METAGRSASSAVLASLATVFACTMGVAAEDDGWVSLFDGETLAGWIQKNGTATYRVEDGAIIGKTTEGSPNSFLCTVKDYGNFELEFEVKLFDAGLNSGVQIRSQTKGGPKGRVNGPQVEIEASRAKGADPLFPAFTISYKRLRFVDPATACRLCVDYDINVPRVNRQRLAGAPPQRLPLAVFETKGPSRQLPHSLTYLTALGVQRDSFSKYLNCYELIVGGMR